MSESECERDLSFLEANGANATKKTLRALKAMETDQFETYKLRVIVSQCCRTTNVSLGGQTYRSAKSNGVKCNLVIYSNLVNLLSGLGELGSGSKRQRDETPREVDMETAFLVFCDMKDAGFQPTESCYSALIRGSSNVGNWERALSFLQELKESECCPRQRSFSPLIDVLSKAGQIDDAFNVFYDMVDTYKLTPYEQDYRNIFSVCCAKDDDRLYKVLDAFLEDILVPVPSTREVILSWFQQAGRKDKGYSVVEKEISPTGIVNGTQIQLQSIGLSTDNSKALLGQIEKLAKERDRTGHVWNEFKAFLAKRKSASPDERITAVIDGANIGYYKANFEGAPKHVNYHQIDWVVRRCIKDGEIPLIVLHSRHVDPKKIPAEYASVVQRWKDEELLYVTPAGSNDDWYWMFIAVFLECRHIVTNDIMRDHHFLLLSPRWFGRWRERHQVKFSFGKWQQAERAVASTGRVREVVLERPHPYSYRLQKVEVNHLPGYFFPKCKALEDGSGDGDGEQELHKWWCACKF